MTNSSDFSVTTAFDGTHLATLKKHNLNAAQRMLAQANTAFNHRFDNALNTPERIDILNKLADLVNNERDEFAQLIAQEGGKPLKDAQVEVTRAIDGIYLAIKAIPDIFLGEEVAMNINVASQNRRAYTRFEPIGVVFAISAFNHPLNLIIHQVIPGIAVGCPVIIKPSLNTPLNCLRLVELLHQSGLPTEHCQVLLCDNDVAEAVACSEHIHFFSFIGSAAVGWYLKSKLAPGVRCALEHGGIAPVIIDKNLTEKNDLHHATRALCKGAFYHAGQVCVSVQRIFVHDSMAEAFTQGLREAAQSLITGDALSPDTDVGPLIEPQHVERIDRWINEAINEGANLVCGGQREGHSTYAPTILLNPALESKVSKQEIFGPVVCIYTYNEPLEAINQANAFPFAFQASVISHDVRFIETCIERLDASAVMVNDHTAFRVDWMPFAGRKQSGYGIGGIEHSMKDMVQHKMVVFNNT
jgi:acyl-CoA reductase-like NAD-dependent aldehyde dehydrogenase